MAKAAPVIPVDDIRPASIVDSDAYAKARAEDLLWMRNHKDTFIEVPCPACGENGVSEHLSGIEWAFCRCANCYTLYMKKRLPEDILHRFFQESSLCRYWSDVLYPATEQTRINNIYEPRAERLLQLCRKQNASFECFIEVGAGSGAFLQLLRDKNTFDSVVAIEPGPTNAELCRRRGLKTFEMPVEKMASFAGSVVASFEVIEHLFSPLSFLENMANVLGPNGLCFITTPNSLSAEVLELRERSTTIGYGHINLFTPDSLCLLARRAGFEVLEILTPGILDVDLLRNGYKENASNYTSPFLDFLTSSDNAQLNEKFQHFLVKNNLSSHMWAVLRKSRADNNG